MRKLFIVILFVSIPLSALLYVLFRSNSQADDELGIALGDNSFLPIKPPSKLHTVGAIYYIEPGQTRITRLCSPHNEISLNAVQDSPGPVISGVLTLQGTYGSKMEAKTGQLIGGRSSVDDQRVTKLNFKLTNVRIRQIDVDSGKKVLDKLMNSPNCSDTVIKYWHLGGYICQDTQLLIATAIFDSDSESNTVASLDLDTQKSLASEIEAKTGVRLTDTEGRSTSTTGEGLQWGMQIPPLCITPPWARFPRTFPRTSLDRVLNFIRFNIVEPIFPATPAT